MNKTALRKRDLPLDGVTIEENEGRKRSLWINNVIFLTLQQANVHINV